MRQRQAVQTTAARRKFQSFKKEEPNVTRQAQVHKEPFDRLYAAWEKYLSGRLHTYNVAEELVRNIDYSADDIQKFLISSADYASSYASIHGHRSVPLIINNFASIFIGAAINLGKDTTYEITVPPYCEDICIGDANTKNILLKGNVRNVGSRMRNGTITISDAHDLTNIGSDMEGGTIRVTSPCVTAYVGTRMKGGLIIFSQETAIREGAQIGRYMQGGKIIFEKSCCLLTTGRLFTPEVYLTCFGDHMRKGKILFKELHGEFRLQNKKGKKGIYIDGEKIMAQGRLKLE